MAWCHWLHNLSLNEKYRDTGFGGMDLKAKTNVFKQIFLAALMLLIALPNGFSARAASPSIHSVVVDHAQKRVTVTGNVGVPEERLVSIKVVKPDGVSEDYFGQTSSSADGTFQFTFVIGPGEVEDALYTVYVFTDDVNAAMKAIASFRYYGENAVRAALAALNSTPADEMGSFLIQYNEIFSLSIGADSAYGALKDKTSVHAALSGKSFASTDAVRLAFEQAVAAQQQVEVEEGQKQDALDMLRNAQVQEMETVLDSVKEILNIDMQTQCYTGMGDTQREELYAILAAAPLPTVGSAAETFDKAVMVLCARDGSRQTIASILNEYDHILGFNGNDKYQNLSENGKANVRKMLVGLDFSGLDFQTVSGLDAAIDKMEAAFAAAVDEENERENNSNSNSGGSGGGGSGGGGGGSKSTSISLPPANNNLPVLQPDEQPQSAFNDLDDAAWAQESILALADLHIVDGFEDNSFRPNENITREQFVKLLVSAFGLYDENAQADFHDADAAAWYYPYVASAVKCGIVEGLGDGTFGVGTKITRQDMAVIAHRTMKYLEVTIPAVVSPSVFADQEEIAPYAQEAVSALQQGGIINGVEPQTFAPVQSCTRAMAAKVIYELYQIAG